MSSSFTATSRITISATAARIWQALTDPALIKKYRTYTDAVSNWTVGSPLTFKGVLKGKPFEDKGVIQESMPPKLLVSTFWSSTFGLPDKPENYTIIRYEISNLAGRTALEVSQENIPSKSAADRAEGNWAQVLKTLKDLLEH